MNAAAKVIYQSNLFDGSLADLRLSRSLILKLMLGFAILCSALAVVYSTNHYRAILNQLEQAEQQQHQLKLQRSQLLLEQASLSRAAKIEQQAYEQLTMHRPAKKEVIQL